VPLDPVQRLAEPARLRALEGPSINEVSLAQ
jgi:hypothetical protein